MPANNGSAGNDSFEQRSEAPAARSRASTQSPPQTRRRITSEPKEEAARPVRTSLNTIRLSRPRVRQAPESAAAMRDQSTNGTREGPETGAPGPSPPKSTVPDPKQWAVPDAVRARFAQDGRRYYFPDGEPAFRDRGQKLTTQSENTALIASLIEIAGARGWQRIHVSGTNTFRQAAWQQARQRGIEVRGYRPSRGERAALALTLSRRADEVANQAPPPARPPTAPAAAPTSDSPRVGSPVAEQTPPGPVSRKGEELLIGKLLDHGRENYRFDPHEEMTYFVRIETPQGRKQVVWGKDLERAVRESLTQPKAGDVVALRRTGADEVTVKRKERDEDGRVTSEKELDTQRHRWQIEKQEFFEQRAAVAAVVRDARIEPRRAVKSHPELAGTYLNLRAAEIAARAFRDPQDQQRFVDRVRSTLANEIARGEALPVVRLREARAVRPADPERELAPVRG